MSRPIPFPRTGPTASWLMILALVASFCLSSMTLAAIGINYDGVGGNALFKIHPANWLFALALAANLVEQPRPAAYLRRLPRAFPGVTLFALMTSVTLVFAALVQHAPFTPLVDTFFAGIALLILYEGVAEPMRHRIRFTLHAIMILNACVGVGEFLAHARLTPFVVAGAPILHDERSTALFGHPLLNAGTTAGYVIALFLGGSGPARPLARAALIAVGGAALVAFGGRTAIVLVAVILALGSLSRVAGVLNGRRFDRAGALALALLTPLLLAGLAVAASKGLFAGFLDRFVEDKGSTQARVAIFELFDGFTLEDLLLGPDPGRLASLQRRLGIEYGIENSWLGLMFQYGALMAGFFVAGLLALFGDIGARSRRNVGVLILYFLVLVSGAASLSVKSFAFNQFAIVLLVLFDETAPGRRARAEAPRNPLSFREPLSA